MKWDSKTIVVVAIFFLLPLQTVFLLREPIIDGEKWQYGTIGMYLSDLLLLGVLLLVIASPLWRAWQSRGKIYDLRFRIYERERSYLWFSIPHSSILNHKSEGALVLLIAWSGLSVFWASDSLLAASFFVKLLLGVGAFLMARSLDERWRAWAMAVFILAAVVQSMFGIAQFLAQEVPASTILGMSAHEPARAGASVLKLESGRFLRAYGTLPHPNMLGGFLAVALVLAIGWWPAQMKGNNHVIASEAWRSHPWMRGFLMVSAVIILLGLILTFSRAAWLGAAAGIGVLLVSVWKREICDTLLNHKPGSAGRTEKKYIIQKCINYLRPCVDDTWLAADFLKKILVLVIAIIAFGGVLHEQVFPRFDQATIAREGSVSERVVSLQDAKTLIAEHPLIGVGAGNFTAALIEREPNRPIWSIQPAHNVFVLVFAELGVVGLLLFVGFLFTVLQSKVFNPQSTILLALLPSLLLDHWLWSSHFGLLLFFVFLSLVSRK